MSSNWIIIGAFFLLAAIARLYVINDDVDDPADGKDTDPKKDARTAPSRNAETQN